ncbi:mediator of RNA polymerase ii transcription subunit 31 protein [Rutstroemia sp. NJR-2017a BVV2]|nr:mediator of RNA polymerase ii transcription subunit 31 protein [Rutstroemia sp. NJR-2017a BVV2]
MRMSDSALQDVIMKSDQSPPPVPDDSNEPKFGGFTRFEIELEFVNGLSSPLYLNHLASLNSGTLLSSPAFVAYLAYLQYFTQPPYLKYLTYPGPSLKHLELLQNETFRRDCLSLEVVGMLQSEDYAAVERWNKE